MTGTMVAMLWFTAGTACCSIFALYVALSTSALCRSMRPSALSTRLALFEERIEGLELAIKTLRSRLSMQDLRARRAGASPEPTSTAIDAAVASADDKAEIRRRLNTIKPGG
jgi:hypothetical protein